MKVTLEQIPPEGLQLDCSNQDGWLREVFVRLAGAAAKEPPISVRLELSATNRTVRVKGEGHAEVRSECARCLKEVDTEVDPRFDIALIPSREGEIEDDEVELTTEELDEYTYDGNQIDVGEIVNEQFMLALPYRVLCQDDCAGLCPECGADLNVSSCECKKASGGGAFAALADIKLEEKRKK